MKKSLDFPKHSRVRSIIGLVLCILLNLSLLVSLTINVADVMRYQTPESGVNTFRMFTTLSNVVVSGVAALSIPYFIDGIRRKDHFYPRWLVSLMHVGVSGVALTFLVAGTLISAYQGFVRAMFGPTTILMHTVNPVLAIALFVFVKPHHHIRFRNTFWPLVPIGAYMLTYAIMVFAIGPENGGWRDHYETNTYMPWPVSALLLLSIAYGVSVLIWFGHNKMNQRLDRAFVDYYLYSDVFATETVEEAVAIVAKQSYETKGHSYIRVPVKVLDLLNQRFGNAKPIEDLCRTYLNEVLAKNPESK